MPITAFDQFKLFCSGRFDDLSQAECYFNGVIVARDLEVALVLYKKAANNGLKGAYYKIGLIYQQQAGREQESAEAYYRAVLEGDLLAEGGLKDLAESWISHSFSSFRAFGSYRR
jgi:TPR repeat protein